jgi:DNA repair exonuclease SbcCD ATPase subunit
MSSVDARLDRIEGLLGDLIYTVGLLMSQFEDEKEKNQKRFERMDKRFEQIDKRFEQIDKRFEQIGKRFEQIDRRFEQIDRRFEQVDRRFDQLEQRIDRMETRMDRRMDDFMLELGKNRQEHEYMASRIFRAEMELDLMKKQTAGVKEE